MANEQYPHLFLDHPTDILRYTNPQHGGPAPRFPSRDRFIHAAHLQAQFDLAWQKNNLRRAISQSTRNGIYLEFRGEPGYDLKTKSLEAIQSGIRLLNIRKENIAENEQTIATIYMPLNRRHIFLKKLHDYETAETTNGKPKNSDFIESISEIRLAILESFWQDPEKPTPGNDRAWIEIWLSSDHMNSIAAFQELVEHREMARADGVLIFPERSVLLVNANRSDLEYLIENSDGIAELRSAAEVSTFFLTMNNADQSEWVNDLLSRSEYDPDTTVTVTILDSGVNAGHALIRPVLSDDDQHAVRAEWGVQDDPHFGHGTLMAGTIIYGDLAEALETTDNYRILHRIESVKILPPWPAQNTKEFWGFLTAQGLSRAEIQAPDRKRIICLAVSSTEDIDRGRPSSWSAEIDAVTSGAEDSRKRFFIISAGNADDPINYMRYPDANQSLSIHNPGQSWNAITVGAFTNKTKITDTTLENYQPVAHEGELSPFSTTSLIWPRRKWPIKPEVVFEGGNVAIGPNDSVVIADDLQLISTYHDPQIIQFAPFGQTSAAAAQAAWMAAQIQARYPEAWPETIRALIVHSAEWTDAMKRQFLPESPGKEAYERLLRICGYGVPNLERALHCAANFLTLISQNELQPYSVRDGRAVTNDLHFYRLPWPSDVLRDMGEAIVTMRVTLSYFIEPGPGQVGWQDRYRYPSHALRFAVNGPGESEQEFLARINLQMRGEEGHPGTEGPQDRWLIGNARNVGSIHSDAWHGSAAELAASNLICVYPAVGWWRERKHLGRLYKSARYSLIVSILTPESTVNIYTPVAATIRAAIPITIPSR